MNVLITGANGFIAKKTACLLKKEGLFVSGTSRKPVSLPEYDKVARGVLGEPLEDIFTDHRIDAVVHCAYDKDDADNVRNAEGTLIWAEQAEKNGAGIQIFMSSISADPGSLSPYGRKKYEVEQWFIEHKHIVLRLGLVVGEGGLFGRIITMVRKSPVIPLIDRGKTPMYPSDADMVCEIIRDTILGKSRIEKGRVWYLNQKEKVFFIDILREIRKQYGLFRIFVPVPYFVVSALLGLTEKIKFLKLGINTSNLKWSRQAGDREYPSDLDYLGYQELSIESMINKLIN